MRKPVSELTLEQFLKAYPRIAGAEEPPDDSEGEPKPDTEGDPKPEDKPDPKPAPVPQDEQETISKAELAALRRKVAEAEKDRRKHEREAREAEEARQRQQGEYQQLAETKAREADDLRARLEAGERERRVSKIARKLKFRDPDDVIGRLSTEEADDDTLAENALERIAEQKPYLLEEAEKPKPEIGRVMDASAGPPDGKGNGRARDASYYEQMSQQELAELPDEEFQKALRLLKAAGKL